MCRNFHHKLLIRRAHDDDNSLCSSDHACNIELFPLDVPFWASLAHRIIGVCNICVCVILVQWIDVHTSSHKTTLGLFCDVRESARAFALTFVNEKHIIMGASSLN